jgi:hypothetical protein
MTNFHHEWQHALPHHRGMYVVGSVHPWIHTRTGDLAGGKGPQPMPDLAAIWHQAIDHLKRVGVVVLLVELYT